VAIIVDPNYYCSTCGKLIYLREQHPVQGKTYCPTCWRHLIETGVVTMEKPNG